MKIFKNLKKQKASASRKSSSEIPIDIQKEPRIDLHFPINKASVLKRPLISEKANFLTSQNQYIFVVHENSNKNLVKKEVERRYDVKVQSVNMIKNKGKIKKWGAREGRRASLKKAIVKLKEGFKIEVA